MNKLVLVSAVTILTLFTSCSDKTPKEQIEVVVHTYIKDMLKDESNAQYQIDSIKIDNITEKDRLKSEALQLKTLSDKKLKEAKELGKEYQVLPTNSAKEKFEILQTEIVELHEKAKGLAQQSQTADSLELLYYDVAAKGTITAPNGVQKNTIIPFYISKDYKIIKEPTELRKEQLELMGE